MSQSQPDLEMGEGTVPIEHLNDESKGEATEMEELYRFIYSSPDSTEKEK